MNEQKLTPWFPGDVKPVRVGYYIREYLISDLSAIPDFWDGAEWHIGFGANRDGVLCHSSISVRQDSRRWRGLAEPPKEEA